jgi:hypothetical protein
MTRLPNSDWIRANSLCCAGASAGSDDATTTTTMSTLTSASLAVRTTTTKAIGVAKEHRCSPHRTRVDWLTKKQGKKKKKKKKKRKTPNSIKIKTIFRFQYL